MSAFERVAPPLFRSSSIPDGHSSYFAGHDAPHFGQTLGLDAVGNLLRLVSVALIDRRYDLVISRPLKLIPECLEVGGRLSVGAGYTCKHGFQLGACLLHFRVQCILGGFVLGIYHRIQRRTRVCEGRAGVTRRDSPSDRDKPWLLQRTPRG